MKKYKTISTPEGTYLVIRPSMLAIAPHEVMCDGYYNDGTRESSLDGYYFKADLIEVKDKREDSKALKTSWDFVEKYYPNYSSSDDICKANDLNLILERKNSIMDEEGTELHGRYMTEFGGRISKVQDEYDFLMKEIYEQAIENFIKLQNQ